MGLYFLVVVCVAGAVLVWLLMRAGAKRPTAGWAWALVFLFAVALAVDIISTQTLGTNSNNTFSTASRQEEEK